ncbi:MAG: von Willebrand factor type A domain-containing protein, partial [Chloroflexota bacterium]|nr:von Willebrand factor type A domain-containing protein [Chloroflexota bacterium]
MTASKYVTSVRGLLGVCLMALAFALAGCAGEFEDDEDDEPRQTTTAQADPATTSPSSPVTTAASTGVPSATDDSDDGAATTGAMVQDSNAEAAPGKEGIGYFGPESGGTANPNDRPLALMYFESHGVNPFVDADEDPLSTFALDGDTASYEILGLYLGEAQLPPPESVRIEEYVNSLPQDYPAAEAALGLHLDAGPSPFGPEGYVLLRVGVSNPRPDTDRDPVSLIFVIDTSGSMAADNRLGLAKTIA